MSKNRKKVMSTRLPPKMIRSLSEIADFEGINRNSVVEGFLKEKIKSYDNRQKAKYLSFSLMTLALIYFGLQMSQIMVF